LVKEKYIIQRNGKDYVLYPGLLDEAHTRFLNFTLTTELIEAGERPIVKAIFSGALGDTDGKQVASIVTNGYGTAGRKGDERGAPATAPIEMAETRAKARALRDAVNMGETSVEELPVPVSEADGPVEANEPYDAIVSYDPGLTDEQRAGLRGAATEAKRAHEPRRQQQPASDHTLDELGKVLDEDARLRGQSYLERWANFEDHLGHPPEKLSEKQAQGYIAQITRKNEQRKAMAENE
jgi:hypothetical protein